MEKTVIVRGGGDIATGVVQKLHRAGLNVLILESEKPTAIRRSVALCEAVYDGIKTVEDITCKKIESLDELNECYSKGVVPLLIDPNGRSINELKPTAVIDAIIAKRNLGTNKNMAAITIALGPGFIAGEDVHAVIETKRGHDLGRILLKGQAEDNTGEPGEVAGESTRRVVYAPVAGIARHMKSIGDIVKQGDALLTISTTTEVTATIDGLLRGLIREGIEVSEGLKIADIDPRTDIDYQTISDKARCIGGAVLEAYYYLSGLQGEKQ